MATRSPVRVAQFALPAFTSTALTAAARFFRLNAANPHRRGLHAILRENGRGRGRGVGDDQTEIVLLDFADARIDGRVAVARRQLHLALFS